MSDNTKGVSSISYVVDVDGTICTTENGNYFGSKPIKERIEKMNKLYDEGNEIIYHTARGYKSGINWREVTENQFKYWGVKYHKLILKKPFGCLYIGDNYINDKDFFK